MKRPAYNSDPYLKGLPEYLKNPANFIPIQKQILETLAVGHSHSELEGYAKCMTCTDKMLERRKLLKKLGFKNAKQYYAWRKVHEEIAKRYPLVDWKIINLERTVEKLNESTK